VSSGDRRRIVRSIIGRAANHFILSLPKIVLPHGSGVAKRTLRELLRVAKGGGGKVIRAQDMGVEVPETHMSACPDAWRRLEICQLALGQRFRRPRPNNPRNAGMYKTGECFDLADESRRSVQRLYSFRREKLNRDQVTCRGTFK
jgi:hypothetical protein